MTHSWELQKREGLMKVYACAKCGAGPVHIPELSTKKSITQEAKRQGVDSNCLQHLVNTIHKL